MFPIRTIAVVTSVPLELNLRYASRLLQERFILRVQQTRNYTPSEGPASVSVPQSLLWASFSIWEAAIPTHSEGRRPIPKGGNSAVAVLCISSNWKSHSRLRQKHIRITCSPRKCWLGGNQARTVNYTELQQANSSVWSCLATKQSFSENKWNNSRHPLCCARFRAQS